MSEVVGYPDHAVGTARNPERPGEGSGAVGCYTCSELSQCSQDGREYQGRDTDSSAVELAANLHPLVSLGRGNPARGPSRRVEPRPIPPDYPELAN